MIDLSGGAPALMTANGSRFRYSALQAGGSLVGLVTQQEGIAIDTANRCDIVQGFNHFDSGELLVGAVLTTLGDGELTRIDGDHPFDGHYVMPSSGVPTAIVLDASEGCSVPSENAHLQFDVTADAFDRFWFSMIPESTLDLSELEVIIGDNPGERVPSFPSAFVAGLDLETNEFLMAFDQREIGDPVQVDVDPLDIENGYRIRVDFAEETNGLDTRIEIEIESLSNQSRTSLPPAAIPGFTLSDARYQVAIGRPDDGFDAVGIDNVFLRYIGFGVGDCDGDGRIAFSDLSCPMNSAIERTLEELDIIAGDFNADGSVDFADFLILSHNFFFATEEKLPRRRRGRRWFGRVSRLLDFEQ